MITYTECNSVKTNQNYKVLTILHHTKKKKKMYVPNLGTQSISYVLPNEITTRLYEYRVLALRKKNKKNIRNMEA